MNNDQKGKNPLLEFPCEFPIKVMGNSGNDFEVAVYSIINKHVLNLPEGAIKINPSKQGNYTAITVTITANSQQQLDNIYLELTACDRVIMAL